MGCDAMRNPVFTGQDGAKCAALQNDSVSPRVEEHVHQLLFRSRTLGIELRLRFIRSHPSDATKRLCRKSLRWCRVEDQWHLHLSAHLRETQNSLYRNLQLRENSSCGAKNLSLTAQQIRSNMQVRSSRNNNAVLSGIVDKDAGDSRSIVDITHVRHVDAFLREMLTHLFSEGISS